MGGVVIGGGVGEVDGFLHSAAGAVDDRLLSAEAFLGGGDVLSGVRERDRCLLGFQTLWYLFTAGCALGGDYLERLEIYHLGRDSRKLPVGFNARPTYSALG